jgi:hypothetical protein
VTDRRASLPGIFRAVLAVVAILVAFWVGLYLITPREVPLPPGASALRLQTQPRSLVPFNIGCPLGLLGPIVVGHDDAVMVFTVESSGRPIKLAWPFAWSARLVNGRAEVVTPDGSVFAREGDVIRNRLTGGALDDGTFQICSTDEVPNNPVIPSVKPPDPM